MKIIWHRISIQTLLFQACLPTRQNGVENRDKAYFREQMDVTKKIQSGTWEEEYPHSDKEKLVSAVAIDL